MQTSEKTFLLPRLLIVSTLALTACNLPSPKEKPQDSGNDSATFAVETVKGDAIEGKTKDSFNLPMEKIFNFAVCLKDTRDSKSIAGHKFTVTETEKTVTTDKAGCLNWSETVSYNFLAESKYLQIERSIQAQGLHRGSRKVTFAINPWSHGEQLPAVLDSSKSQVPVLVKDKEEVPLALKGLSKDQQGKTRSLWIEDGRLFVTEQGLGQNKVTLLIEVRSAPSLQMTKMNGELFLRPLTAGEFQARLTLIHSYNQDNKEIRRILGRSEAIKTRIASGNISIKAPVTLDAVPTRGQVILGIELAPVNGPAGMTSFDGIYMLGEYDQLKVSTFLKVNTLVTQTKDFKLQNFVTQKVSDLPKNPQGNILDDVYQRPKIEVAPLEFRFIQVGRETTTTKEVIYNIRACVRHGVDQKNTRAHTFTVTKYRQSPDEEPVSIEVKTDNNACINWDESIKFEYFACQRYIKGFVNIVNKDLGMNEKLEIIVNPWETFGILARDMRYVDPTEPIAMDCKKEERPRTQILMDHFSYTTLSYDYKIDSSLNLSVVKKIQFKTEPRLQIYSSLANGRAEVEKLRDGIYVLKVAIVRNRDYDSNNTYVTSAEKLVNVLNGQINTDLTFVSRDLKALGNRNTILIEVYPAQENLVKISGEQMTLRNRNHTLDSVVDHSSQLVTPTFQGAITLNTDEANRPLRLLDPTAMSQYLLESKGQMPGKENVIAQIITEGLKRQSQSSQAIQEKTRVENFAKDHNLELINLQAQTETDPLRQSLKIFTVGGQEKNPQGESLQLSKTKLGEILRTGKISAETARRLCVFWAQDFLPSLAREKGGAILPHLKYAFSAECAKKALKNPESFFQIERRLIVKELGGFQFQRGLNHGLTTGTSFSLSNSHSKTHSTSRSVTLKAGLSKKILDLVSLGLDANYTISWSAADSNTAGNTISVNTQTSMTVQQNVFNLRFNKYELCTTLRLNPLRFMKDTKSSWWSRETDLTAVLNNRLSDDEKAQVATRGVLLCEGEIRQQPIERVENYYLVAQETGSTQMQDAGDSRNRTFFVALRSQNDYQRFVTAIRDQSKAPTHSLTEGDPQNEVSDMMVKLFQLGDSTYPGMYLLK